MFRAVTAASSAASSARVSSLHRLRQEVPLQRHRLAAPTQAWHRAYSDQSGDAPAQKAAKKNKAKKAKQTDAPSSSTPAPTPAKAQRSQFVANPSNRTRVPLSVNSDLDAPFQSPFSAYQSPTAWDPTEDTGMALPDPVQARLQNDRLKKAFEQPRRYVAMVVDADALKPPLDLLQHGYEGGHAWHQRCVKRIREHLGVPAHHELDVRMYLFANQTGLSAFYDRQHNLNPRTFFEFCRGVTEAGPITIFTDAGRKDQAADQKVKAFMTDCLMDPSLIHLYLGGLNDYGYVPELTALRTMGLLDKVSLLFLPGPALTSRHYGEYQKRVILWTDCFEDLAQQGKDLRWKASELAAATWHRLTQMLPQADPVSGKFSSDQGAAPFSTLAAAPATDPPSSPSTTTDTTEVARNSPIPSSLNMPDSFVKFVYLQLRSLYPEDARAELRSRQRAGTGTGYGFGFSSASGGSAGSGTLRDGNANADVRARARAPENSMLNVPGARDFREEKGGYKKALRAVGQDAKVVQQACDARLPEDQAREAKFKPRKTR